MASAKKKPSAKQTQKTAKVKYAAKSQARTAASSAQRSSADWIKGSTAEWQKGAQDWAKQSAKLYQLPFGQSEATEAAKSATEGMMNFAQQMFDQSKKGFSNEAFNPSSMFKNAPHMPKFDAKDAQEKFSSFARESAEQLNKTTANSQHSMNEAAKLARENTEVLVEVTNILLSVSKELGAEFVSYLNKSFTQNVDLSKQVLTCRTLNDLFDLSNRAVKTNLDSFFSESIKLSEKLFRVATDVSEPLNERVSETSARMSKAFSA